MPKKPPAGQCASRVTLAKSLAFRETGTDLAKYNYTSSCSLVRRDTAVPGAWGGARNRGDRETIALADDKVDALLSAAVFALATGRTFQRHWIVHYGKAGIAEHDAARFIGRLLHQLGKQARRAGGELVALWVRETASDLGGHVHILLHLPPDMVLRNRTRRWIVAAGGRYETGVSRTKRIGGRLTNVKVAGTGDGIDGAHYRANAENVVRYLLKSADLEKGESLGLKYSGRGGRIVGKRCGWTQNIGWAARKLAAL